MDDPFQFLDTEVEVRIDRPLGSRHPNYDYVYPVNYGYLPGTTSGDGEPLDAYVLGPDEPVDVYVGICVAVILREEEEDPKLVVVPSGEAISDARIRVLTRFQERYFTSRIERRRPGGSRGRSLRCDGN